MRIALVTDWFLPRPGGIETQLGELARRLAERGHEVDVLTSTPGARDGAAYRVRAIRAPRLPGWDVALSPRVFSAVDRELKRTYDVVHAHVSVVSPVGYAAALAARRRGLPVTVTFHSVLRAKQLLLGAAGLLLGLRRSPIVWSAVSQRVAREVGRALPGCGVTVLPNGVDVRFWRGAPRNEAPPSGALPRTFVTTQRLQPKKRPVQLARAFHAAVIEARMPARLILFGDGSERRAVEAAARDAARDGALIELPGWIPLDALRGAYARADAFVSATRREAFGIAALEARVAGLPVIAMREAGSSEFLEHGVNALLCDDDAALRRAVAALLGDDALRARLRAAPATGDQYDWSHVVLAHERVYEVARRRAGAAVAPVPATA